MSLMSAIRAAARGTGKSRLDEEKPDDLEEEDRDAEEEEETSTDDETTTDDDPDPDAEADEGSEDEEASDEEDDPQMSERDRRLVLGEQRRIAAILTHGNAEANPDLAAKLAFSPTHRMSAKRACDLLSAGASAAGKLSSRMRGRSPRIGAGPSGNAPSEKEKLVAGIRGTIQARHGRKREA